MAPNIVMKHRFSTRANGRTKGTRGSTPQNYITQYMTRKSAVENIHFYQKPRVPTLQKYQGCGFGKSSQDNVYSMSLKDWEVDVITKTIGRYFQGRTTYKDRRPVLETVLSFDTPYLKRMNCLVEDKEKQQQGLHFAGQVDQVKLRCAIMNALQQMEFSRFDDLAYVGVIHINTDHVHCHLAMVDVGKGFTYQYRSDSKLFDNQQKGSLSKVERQDLLDAVNLQLESMKAYQPYVSSIENTKQLETQSEQVKDKQTLVRYAQLEQMMDKGVSESHIDTYLENVPMDVTDTHRQKVRDVVSQVGSQSFQPSQLSTMKEYSVLPLSTLERKAQEGDELAYGLFRYRTTVKKANEYKQKARFYLEKEQAYEQISNASVDSQVLLGFYQAQREYYQECLLKYQSQYLWVPDKKQWSDLQTQIATGNFKESQMQALEMGYILQSDQTLVACNTIMANYEIDNDELTPMQQSLYGSIQEKKKQDQEQVDRWRSGLKEKYQKACLYLEKTKQAMYKSTLSLDKKHQAWLEHMPLYQQRVQQVASSLIAPFKKKEPPKVERKTTSIKQVDQSCIRRLNE